MKDEGPCQTWIEIILYRAKVQFIKTLQNFIYKHTIDSKNCTKILKKKGNFKICQVSTN
jgi:hypothetical protein